MLYCIVEVEFYADDRDALIKDKPTCAPWTEDLFPEPDEDEEDEIKEEEAQDEEELEDAVEDTDEIEINFDFE